MKIILEIIKSSGKKGKFEFDKLPVIFGRISSNDIMINDQNVSRRHAKIEFKDSVPVIFDLNSQNGTFVNKNRITQIELKKEDIIQIGETEFRFTLSGLSKKEPVSQDTVIKKSEKGRYTAPFQRLIHAEWQKIIEFFKKNKKKDIIKNLPKLIKNYIIAGVLGLFFIVLLFSFPSKKSPIDEAIINDNSHIPISIPAQDVYGNCKQDRTHKDKAIFIFKGKKDNKAFLTYTIGGIDKRREIEIFINGETIGYPPVTNGWKQIKNIALPLGKIDISEDNLLVFNNTLNPPGDETWGITDVNITFRQLPECSLKAAREHFELAENKYKDKSISYPNLYQSMKAYQSSIDCLEMCSEKPDFYHKAKKEIKKTSLELEKEYQKHLFNAQKAFRLKEYKTAVTEYKIILSKIPDTQDYRYQTAEDGLNQDIP